MLRMRLVIVLRLFAGEADVQPDLIALIHNRAVAAGHFADVKMRAAGNGFQELVSGGNDGIGGFRFVRVGPEKDNV